MGSNLNLTDREAVAMLEEWFQRSLPADFARWVVDPDAVYPAPAEVPIPAESPWVDRLGAVYAPQQSLQMLHEDAEMVRQGVQSSFPNGTLPFGESYGENYYLLSMRDEDHGSVLFMDHETVDRYNDFQGLITLTDSFTAWLSTLTPVPEDERLDPYIADPPV
jgi:hypothetical protein